MYVNVKVNVNLNVNVNGQNDHFQAWSPRVAKGLQGSRGTPGMVEMSQNQIDYAYILHTY